MRGTSLIIPWSSEMTRVRRLCFWWCIMLYLFRGLFVICSVNSAMFSLCFTAWIQIRARPCYCSIVTAKVVEVMPSLIKLQRRHHSLQREWYDPPWPPLHVSWPHGRLNPTSRRGALLCLAFPEPSLSAEKMENGS